jgi:glycine C-acetyltransferase
MAKHSQHDVLDAVHRLSTAAADAAEDLAALRSGQTTLTRLDADRPLVRTLTTNPAAVPSVQPPSEGSESRSAAA